MIYRDIEEPLNLRRMQIERQNPIRPGPLDHAGDELRRDRNPGFVLPVLAGVSILG